MTGALSDCVVSVAFANGADVVSWRWAGREADLAGIEGALAQLRKLGHVAAYGLQAGDDVDQAGLIAALSRRLGPAADAAFSSGPLPRSSAAPAFLMPVWPFDHDVQGKPAATGHLLGLDLHLTATLTSDEEVGAHLPGREGLWLIRAGPLGA